MFDDGVLGYFLLKNSNLEAITLIKAAVTKLTFGLVEAALKRTFCQGSGSFEGVKPDSGMVRVKKNSYQTVKTAQGKWIRVDIVVQRRTAPVTKIMKSIHTSPMGGANFPTRTKDQAHINIKETIVAGRGEFNSYRGSGKYRWTNQS